jgi:TonB-dependent starch-binding outer membrane protein SusC
LGATGLTPTQLANVNLGWEQAEEINLGMDYSVFGGRVSGSVDAYTRENKQLLFDRPLPTDSGFEDITENIGVVQNQGIEIDLRTVNISRADFSWSTSFNISFERNEILELPDGEPIRRDNSFTSLQEGQPIGLIQVARWAGVNPADGRPMWYDENGNITYTPTEDDLIKYNDGKSNRTGGIGNTFSYRGITLDAFLEFQAGQWGDGSTDRAFTRTPDFLMNLHSKVKNRWKEPGDVTRVPRAIVAGTDYTETANYRTTLGTHVIHNAGYLRLKNVTLSYALPVGITEAIGIRNLRVFASGVNLVTWTQWPWYDPEIAWDTRDIYQNVTTASYPTARQLNFGIEIDF